MAIEPGLPVELHVVPDATGETASGVVTAVGAQFPDPEIYDELEFTAAIHLRLGCRVIDVSELSIEETAQRILRAVQPRALGTRAT